MAIELIEELAQQTASSSTEPLLSRSQGACIDGQTLCVILPQAIYLSDRNKLQHKKKLLDYIQTDFENRGKPAHHFWHNIEIIASACDENSAMIVLNNKEEIIGYMIWSMYDGGAEIIIVEVREDCRRQGLFKQMLSGFTDKFKELSVLSAYAVPQAQEIFKKLGWERVQGANREEHFFKIVKQVLRPLKTLPQGPVIAVCSEEFYRVANNLNQYKPLMKYFPIELDEDKNLRVPIVTDFAYEGYVGVYFNKELITENKLKRLFSNTVSRCNRGLLVINRIDPLDSRLCDDKRFFSQCHQKDKNVITLNGPPIKRQRVESQPTFFQSGIPIVGETPIPQAPNEQEKFRERSSKRQK